MFKFYIRNFVGWREAVLTKFYENNAVNRLISKETLGIFNFFVKTEVIFDKF